MFYQQPNASDGAPLQPLEVTLFNPAYDKDRFESTAWTVNGKFGRLKAVYTGGYLVRNVEQIGDYTNYARGVYADYYQCYGQDRWRHPDADLLLAERRPGTRTSEQAPAARIPPEHAGRLARARHRRRILGGQQAVRPDRLELQDRAVVHVERCGGHPAIRLLHRHRHRPRARRVVNPGIQPAQHLVLSGHRARDQADGVLRLGRLRPDSEGADAHRRARAISASRTRRRAASSAASAASRQGAPPGGCLARSHYNLNAQNLRDTESGFKSRGNLTWHITPDVMVYYTFSQGFRPGGFNQNGGTPHIYGTDGNAAIPACRSSYQSDKLTNNEIGWKTEFFDHRLQWNGAIYRENWDNVQVAFFDPGLVGNIFYNTNGQNFLVKGIETSLVGARHQRPDAAGRRLLESEPADQLAGADRQQPGEHEFRQAITQACDATGANCAPVTNPFGPIGSPSANAPPMQFSLRARYEWTLAGYASFVQFGATHSGHSFTQAGSNPTFAEAGRHHDRPVAVRESRLHDLSTPRSALPRMPGT